MPELNEVVWEVKLDGSNGSLTANKNIIKKEVFKQKLNNGENCVHTVVNFPQRACLDSILVTDQGTIPPGITPLITNSAEHAGGDLSQLRVVWVCMAYLMSTNGSLSKAETVNNQEPQTENKEENNNGNGQLITQAQTRYLFRLLAEKDIKGKAAEEYLQKALHVDNIDQAPRKPASELIDQLVNSNGGG